MIITTQGQLIALRALEGKKTTLRCKIEGKGVEFLGFGEDLEEAFENLHLNISNYIKNYEGH